MPEVFFAFLWALFLSLFILPTLMRVAFYTDITDKPTSRKRHTGIVPLFGGVGVYAALLTATLLFSPPDRPLQAILAGSFFVLLIGIKDDIMGASPVRRLLVQAVAATMLMTVGELHITDLGGLFGIHQLPPILGYSLTLVLVLGLTNAFNLIDGLDGLLGVTAFLASFMLLVHLWPLSAALLPLLAALCGAAIGFLRYNLFPPRVFMGDTGALVCGFLLAAVCIFFIEQKPVPHAPVFALGIFFYPILDTLRVMYLRLRHARSPFLADRNHLHLQLRDLGLTPAQTLLLLFGLQLFVSALLWLTSSFSGEQLLLLLFVVALLLHFLFLWLRSKSKPKSSAPSPPASPSRS